MKETDLLYGADGDACSTRDYKMAVFDVWPDLIQNKGDDVGLHSQKEHITFIDRLFVASRQVHPHFLQKKRESIFGDGEERKIVKKYGKKQANRCYYGS